MPRMPRVARPIGRTFFLVKPNREPVVRRMKMRFVPSVNTTSSN
jgi:hypothetical protein